MSYLHLIRKHVYQFQTKCLCTTLYNLPFFAEQATKIMSHRNENPVVNFTRTYEDYEHGFGDVRTNNFWLGLYK